ncbi:hypothetical protein J5N97_023280 [Dioscorea zingiberensis]|uniref:Uncharacterized protein n=1 Tax=Dioscorea zingiberensis TaxID=325984 RepID=A0A9D5CCP7_9LILI|nr:hypothetical protein J5N97_023280 [Dioscorea zingiberensis]
MDCHFGWGGGTLVDGWRKGPWTPQEDKLLTDYVNIHGEGRWNSISKATGLRRSGKSCRLRWVNYLRPDLKRGKITPQEENIILELHARWGNRWSTIARSLPGRTDNEIKNYWRTHYKKAKSTKIIMQQQEHQHHDQQKQNNQDEMKEVVMTPQVIKQVVLASQDMDEMMKYMYQVGASSSIMNEEFYWNEDENLGRLWNLDI